MTIWRAGMLAVCVDATPSPVWGSCGLVERKIYRVVGIDCVRPHSLFGEGLCIFVEGATIQRRVGHHTARFRPLNDAEDDAELIARIKNCKPARKPVRA